MIFIFDPHFMHTSPSVLTIPCIRLSSYREILTLPSSAGSRANFLPEDTYIQVERSLRLATSSSHLYVVLATNLYLPIHDIEPTGDKRIARAGEVAI